MKRRRLTRDTSTVASSIDDDETDDDEYAQSTRKPKGGNRKARSSNAASSSSNAPLKPGSLRIPPAGSHTAEETDSPEDSFSLSPLFEALDRDALLDIESSEDDEDGIPFEDVLEDQLPDMRQGRKKYLEGIAETNQWNQILRPFGKMDNSLLLAALSSNRAEVPSRLDALLRRKLKLAKIKPHWHIQNDGHSDAAPAICARVEENAVPKPEPIVRPIIPDSSVIGALESIGTTPFDSSFAARLLGYASSSTSSHRPENEFVFRDWEASTQWLDLMDDIHAFSVLAHPDREQVERRVYPIDYQRLRQAHLPQLHDLLSRTFWPGINVEDALQFSPERCTIVASYGRVVVGAALLSSPNETYITYLVVRSGWEGSHIATKMLYLLLQQSTQQDVILHVSANNPAMLLYNRFGFKAEEFIVGFYDEYLDRDSRASKNAFRLRLRR